MFAFKHSTFERIYLMRWELNAPEAYEDNVRSVGPPNKTVTDNVAVLAEYQNYSKGLGGNFKFITLELYHNNPHAPISYWGFSASHLDKCRRFLSQSTLKDKCR